MNAWMCVTIRSIHRVINVIPKKKRFFILYEGSDKRGSILAKQHYGYEKRQKEIAKQKKQEAKRLRRLEKKSNPSEENQGESSNETGTALAEDPAEIE